MSRSKEQKIKLLVLYDILCKHTDENHHLTTNQIIEMLAGKGIEVSRKVLPDDIDMLNEFGYEVISQKGNVNKYYVIDKQFDAAEALMFSDAVKASKLTEGHKARLVEKLGEAIGEQQAEDISKNLVVCDMPKRSNPNILFYIDLISKAINNENKVSFLYYIDINNCPFADVFIKEGIAVDTGFTKESGFCSYPLWKFNEDFLKEIGGCEYENYSQAFEQYMYGDDEQDTEQVQSDDDQIFIQSM